MEIVKLRINDQIKLASEAEERPKKLSMALWVPRNQRKRQPMGVVLKLEECECTIDIDAKPKVTKR